MKFVDPEGTDPRSLMEMAGIMGAAAIGDSKVGADPGTDGASDPIADRRTLGYQMAHLPGPVRKSIPALVKASNSPSGDDKRGGFHEESLKWGRNSAGSIV